MKKNNKYPMSILEYYLRIVGVFFILLIGWGLVCPILISNSQADLGVALGIILIFVVPILAYLIVKPIFKHFKQ